MYILTDGVKHWGVMKSILNNESGNFKNKPAASAMFGLYTTLDIAVMYCKTLNLDGWVVHPESCNMGHSSHVVGCG